MSAAGGDRELRLAKAAIKAARTHLEQAYLLHPGGPATEQHGKNLRIYLLWCVESVDRMRATRNRELGERRKSKRRAA